MFTVKTIPANTILYRAHDSLDKNEPKIDPDTGKYGLLFSDTFEYSLCLAFERDQPMNISRYITTKDIQLFEGKYSFRGINVDRYIDDDGNFIPNVDVIDNENINHYDSDIFPIIREITDETTPTKGKWYLEIDLDNLTEITEFGEIFINKNDLEFVDFLSEIQI